MRYADPVPKEHLVVVEPVFLNEKEIGKGSLMYLSFTLRANVFSESRN